MPATSGFATGNRSKTGSDLRMNAAVITRYGPPDVVQVREVGRPTPKDNEVLVRVRASTVSAADWRIRKADPFVVRFFSGLLRPTKIRIGGMELAGTVESLGKSVTRSHRATKCSAALCSG